MIGGWLLTNLFHCATATRVGTPHHGFPEAMAKLEGLGLVEKDGNCHKITEKGIRYLRDPDNHHSLKSAGLV